MAEKDKVPVAPADAHYATNADGTREPIKGNVGVDPLASHPDQPAFPAPIGVPREKPVEPTDAKKAAPKPPEAPSPAPGGGGTT